MEYRLISTPWMRWVIYSFLVALLLYIFLPRFLSAESANNFDLGKPLVPVDEIKHGGPPRDGIPAIDDPEFITADDVDFLIDSDRVLAIDRNGIRKAYAIKILNYHEIVNDTYDQESILVSYCPLCGTGMAFLISTDGTTNTFGVSGLLYNSDMLLYDRKTDSLWSQIMKLAISGPMRGSRLQQIVMSHTSWGEWRNRHPDTLVLSTKTGYFRNYNRSPYPGYENSKDLYFPVRNFDARYHPKELVIGLSLNGESKAYPFIELSRTNGDIQDNFAGHKLRVNYDVANRTGMVLADDGRVLPTTISYWFAWLAFYPETEVYTAP